MEYFETNAELKSKVLRSELWVPPGLRCEERFSADRIQDMTKEFLGREVKEGETLETLAQDKQFVVAYISGDDKLSDIARSVESSVFSEAFDEPLDKVVADYGKYDDASVFATVIDIRPKSGNAKPVAAMRIINYDEGLGFKDVNDLLSEDSPWIDEIKKYYFGRFERYSSTKAWERLGIAACGKEIALKDSIDVATHAVIPEYAGKRGSMDGVSMLFYHACLWSALKDERKYILAIYDLAPFDNLQQFGEPFNVYESLSPKKYGGPFATIPAYCHISEGVQRIKNYSAQVHDAFVTGKYLAEHAVLPRDYA